MRRHQELLDEEIGSPPPSRIDVDAVMTRQRRWVRLRQTAQVASGLAATATLVVFAATLSSVAGTTTTIAGAHPSTTHATPPATTPPPDLRQLEAARLSAELQKQITALLPTAQFRPLAEPPDDQNNTRPTSVPLVFSDAGNYFYTSAQVKTSAGIGAIRVQTGQLQTKVQLGPSVCDDPAPHDVRITECVVKPGPNGSAIFIISDTIGRNFQRHFVEITRADGNSVSVEVTTGATEPTSTSSTPALTSQQTQTLAEDPVLATRVP